jgi:hypothetical protein
VCAIQNIERTDESGMKNAAGFVSDLAQNLGSQIVPYADQILEALLSNLNNKEVDTECKFVCLVAVGDLLMAGVSHSKHLDKIIKTYAEAAKMSLNS